MKPFKVPTIKAEYAKNVFGGHFSTEHNGVTDYIDFFSLRNKAWYGNNNHSGKPGQNVLIFGNYLGGYV